jgi:hypothetical protein
MTSKRYFTKSRGIGRGFHKYQDPSGAVHRAARFSISSGRHKYETPLSMRPSPMMSASRNVFASEESAPVVPLAREEVPIVDQGDAPWLRKQVVTRGVRPFNNPLEGLQ